MPDPFRHYDGAPVLDLPADATDASPVDGAAFLSELLFYSAAISASKLAPSGSRYALRVNPSSGNLHPTEFHFLTKGVVGWPDGLFHYRPSSHMAEQRAAGDLTLPGISAPVVFVLTSIAWREAWKYGDRAYRYCLLDIGHACEALALSARFLGCEVVAHCAFPDDDIARHCRLADDEWPMLILELRGPAIPIREPESEGISWYGGEANPLSAAPIAYPLIDAIHQATKRVDGHPIRLSCAPLLPKHLRALARRRRSALDFLGGTESISLSKLWTILNAAALDGSGLIELYLYIHRVDGLKPGVYRYRALAGELELVKPGDQRVAAAGLSLGQDLAGNACVASSMIADIERAVALHGDRGYRYVHFEAGTIGHRFYLAAETLGLGATGIGAFYDDEVHRYLALAPHQGQVVYHFAIGYPVVDPRLDDSAF